MVETIMVEGVYDGFPTPLLTRLPSFERIDNAARQMLIRSRWGRPIREQASGEANWLGNLAAAIMLAITPPMVHPKNRNRTPRPSKPMARATDGNRR